MNKGTLLLFATLAACKNENNLRKDTDRPGETPILEIRPEVVAFGELEPGSSAQQTVIVANVGDVGVGLVSASIIQSTAFTVLDDPTPLELGPGSEVEFLVGYTPSNVADAGALVVATDDDIETEVRASLTGGAFMPLLEIEPSPLDFGTVTLCSQDEQPLTLRNVGTATLVVDAITANGEGFTFGVPDLPLSLEPGQEREMDVSFAPMGQTEHDGTVWVSSNDPVGTRQAGLIGRGGEPTRTEARDTFRQPEGLWEKTDVLFFVDRSLSMDDNIANLQANFTSFVNRLAGLDADYQVAAVTYDDGCINGSIITADTEDPHGAFATATWGSFGEYKEAGLIVTTLALEKSGPGQCNEGLIRPDAKTVIVYVSDEPEQSPESYATYVARMQAVTSSLGIVSVVGDIPLGCGLTADPGYGYYEAAMATRGEMLSICTDDWGSHLEVIAEIAAGDPTDTFPLDYLPDPDTIEVTVDDVPATGWTYDAVQNAVIFDTMPPGGSYVEVSYALSEACL